MKPWPVVPENPMLRKMRDMALLQSLADVPFEQDGHDHAVVVWFEDEKTQVQPVVWPMTLHKHEQGCNRA